MTATFIDTSVNNHVFALDTETGRLAWETPILDYTQDPARHSSGPIIADGMVVSGRSCMPRGGPEVCVITAHDATPGEEVWRRRTAPAPGEPGDETRGGIPFEERVHVGSWMAPSYDPALNLVYIGTSVTSPAPKFMLGRIEKAPLAQLHAGPRRRHRRDPLVLPAPQRPLAPRSSLRAHPRRHRGAARSGGRELDQPAAHVPVRHVVLTGIPRRDERRLHPRPAHRRVPLGAAGTDVADIQDLYWTHADREDHDLCASW